MNDWTWITYIHALHTEESPLLSVNVVIMVFRILYLSFYSNNSTEMIINNEFMQAGLA